MYVLTCLGTLGQCNIIEPRLIRIETNSQFAQIISPSEMISIVT